jgi:hypothetical protein
MDNVVSAAAGHRHTAAVKSDGSLWIWGSNENGQLGNGTTKDSSVPVTVMSDIASVAVSGGNTAAVTRDGSLWAWGWSNGGVLPGDSTEFSVLPEKLMDNVLSVELAECSAYIIKTDGSLWAWGNNTGGQLGNGTGPHRNYLNAFRIMDDVSSVSAGSWYAIAMKTDGSLWCWGSFNSGGNPLDYLLSAPIRIMGDAMIVSAGAAHIVASKTDSSLWAWGMNDYGEFNNGKIDTPVKLMNGLELTTAETTPPKQPPATQPPIIAINFPDLPTSHWAYASIMLLAEKEVIFGYPDSTFKPNGQVTRSEFAKMMTLALEIPLLSVLTPSFVDVSKNDWEFVYVETAKEYLTGYQQGDGYYFKGSKEAIREDMTVALVKALELDIEAADDSSTDFVYARLQETFSDAASITPDLRKYVLISYEHKLISGYPDGTFGAQKTITRAEAAALLVKVLDNVVSLSK